jgi:glycerophosphoryl diester phosphodiesterase
MKYKMVPFRKDPFFLLRPNKWIGCSFLFLVMIMNLKAQVTSPQIIAHRGAWIKDEIPQNSIAALKQAIRYGCHGSEMDVQLTKDNQLVVNHDADYQGLAINTFNYKELQHKRLFNDEPLPLLKDYLEEGLKHPHLTLFVEIKTAAEGLNKTKSTVDHTLQLVQKLGAQSRVVYILFSLEASIYLMNQEQEAQVVYLNGDLSPREAKEKGFVGLDYHYSVFQKNPNWIKEAKEAGLTLNAWTVNEASVMDWLIEQQFDFITTDVPLLVQQRIQQFLHK